MTEVFERAVRECGLSTDAGLVRTNVEQTRLPARSSQAESAQQQGYRTALEVFHGDRSQWPDGIVITDDMMTHGVLAAMAHLGIRPTVDVQIATHANKGITVFLGDPRGLIRLEYDPAEVVRRLFDILEALMNHQIPSGVRPHSPDAQVCFIEPSTVFVD
jgi:DNA-binding LacI/PurR family transcriptional regulator